MTRRKAVTAPAPEPKKRRTKKVEPFVLREGHALVLRTCASDLTSYNGFQWPESGAVEAPDWKSRAGCGNGLHGLLWGIGDGSLLSWDADARWLVVDVLAADVVEIGAKVKFPRCEVVFCGAKDAAVAMLIDHGADPTRVVAGTATAGTRGTATAGYGGTATAGDGGTLIIRSWDETTQRRRFTVGYIGEDGLEPNVAYRLDDQGRFVRVDGGAK
jgi:hypothetical protein